MPARLSRSGRTPAVAPGPCPTDGLALLSDDLHIVDRGLDQARACRVGGFDQDPDRLTGEGAQVDRRRGPDAVVVVGICRAPGTPIACVVPTTDTRR